MNMHADQDDHEIGAFFDRCARKRLMYEFEPDEQEKLKRFLEVWDVRPGQRILEPGCGNGRLTRVLAEATCPDGEVYATDLSPAMLALARERGLPAHVHLVCGSAVMIEREDQWFDRVICLNVFPHLSDKLGALKEFARVLKPDGSLWVNHFEGRDNLNRFHHEAAPEVSQHVLPCPHTMRRMAQEAGFEVVEFVDQGEVYSVKAVKQCR
jgi:demethylmenaquinone methyltransferase/2-methoxy-6-polyprenyl-1,4-benzoquinol methylase